MFFLSAAILLVITFALPLAFSDVRKDPRYCLLLWVCIAIYCAVSAVNAFGGGVKGAGSDAQAFHYAGVVWSQEGSFTLGISAQLYKQFLGMLYSVTEPSIFLGQQISIIAFVLSAVILKKFITLLGVTKWRLGILVLFALLPSMVFRASATLREPFEILLVMLSAYWGLRTVLFSGAHNPIRFGLYTFCAAIAHKALVVYALAALLLFGLARQRSTQGKVRKNKAIIMGIGVVGLCVGVVGVVSLGGKIASLSAANALVTGDVGEIDRVLTSKSAKDARATYGTKVDFSSPVGLITTLPVSVTYYLFAPMPWQVRAPIDVYGLLVGFLRFLLIWAALSHWRASRGTAKQAYGLLLVVYFVLTLLWATGTSNFGTADRHNITHNWIVILLGYPGLAQLFKRFIFRHRPHVKPIGTKLGNVAGGSRVG